MLYTEKGRIIDRRHREWTDYHIRWRWLLDSWEGGEVYRQATYGNDTRNLPIRNLIRHKREYPEPRENTPNSASLLGQFGKDPAYAATDDDYTLRLARTPVPTILSERVEAHVDAVYAREVQRDSTDARLKEWWNDVDGNGTKADQWMSDTIAPLLMVLGCLDIFVDHPAAPADAVIRTVADQRMYRLDRCVASYILPENVVWWQLDEAGQNYVECQICEWMPDGKCQYRVWTTEDWTLYDDEGTIVESQSHPFGRVPIKRIFDRKRPRCGHVGLPRYESIAEIQREYYNRDSELILSDTTQAHPLLQGPEDYVQADGTIPIGPSWLLPKKKNTQGGSATYEGFDVVNFPKDGAESIRLNLDRLIDRADRAAMLTKPAGAQGTTGNTVSQSGVSKRLDQNAGNNLLAKIATTLQKAEEVIGGLALLVLTGIDTPTPELVDITYPMEFDLQTADELAVAITEFQTILAAAGACPETEGEMLERLVRLMLPGASDDDFKEIDDEIEMYLEAKAIERKQMAETSPEGMVSDGTGSNTPTSTAAVPSVSDSAGSGSDLTDATASEAESPSDA